MKRLVILSVVALFILLISFVARNSATSIVGRISPIDGANSVWAINGRDTLTSVVANGNFSLGVKAGTYKVWIDSKEPFKDVSLENIEVKEGQTVDVGEIVLQK